MVEGAAGVDTVEAGEIRVGCIEKFSFGSFCVFSFVFLFDKFVDLQY